MTTSFPTALDTFTNPTPANDLNTPAVLHSDQHANTNDAIEAIEAKVGINGSADPTSLDYRVAALESAPPGSSTWGAITGTLSDQADLQAELDAKVDSADLAAVATSGSYNDLSDTPTPYTDEMAQDAVGGMV